MLRFLKFVTLKTAVRADNCMQTTQSVRSRYGTGNINKRIYAFIFNFKRILNLDYFRYVYICIRQYTIMENIEINQRVLQLCVRGNLKELETETRLLDTDVQSLRHTIVRASIDINSEISDEFTAINNIVEQLTNRINTISQIKSELFTLKSKLAEFEDETGNEELAHGTWIR